MSWAVMRNVDNDDEAEAFGPFSSLRSAETFRTDYEEWAGAGYGYVLIELRPVRQGLAEIRDAKADDQ